MSTTTVFRIAGVSGILAALAMLALTFVSDPNSGMSPVYAVPNAVLGIIFVAGLYLLYRDQESALSLAAAAACDCLIAAEPSTFAFPEVRIGVPTIVVVGRGLASGVVEIKDRRSGQRREVPVGEAADQVCREVGR